MLLVAFAVVSAIVLGGCMPKFPGVTSNGKDSTYRDLAGNEIKTSQDGDKVSMNLKGENGQDVKIDAGKDIPFSDSGLPEPPGMIKVENKSHTFKMDADGKHVVQAIAFSSSSAKEVGDFYVPKFTKVESKAETGDSLSVMGEVDGKKVIMTISKQPEGTMVFVQSQTQ